MGLTATEVVTAALESYLDSLTPKVKPPARVATPQETPLDAMLPWDREKYLAESRGGSVVPEAVIPAIESRLRGQDGPVEEITPRSIDRAAFGLPPREPATTGAVGGPIIINDSKEAAALMETTLATRYVHPFTPVPKPVSKPKARR